MASLKVYVDLMSQPARALLMFLKTTNIPFEKKIVSIAKQEHKTPEYLKIHKFGKIPAIVDGDVNIIETVGIIRYLARKYQVPENWYPKDLVGQARVDEFLEWQHLGLRAPLATYFMAEFLLPMLTGKPPAPATLDRLRKEAVTSLGNVENIWLKDTPYVTGNKISVADLIGLCEIEQLRLTSFDPFSERPKLTAWAQRLRAELNPHYDDVHIVFNKVLQKTKGSKL